MDESERQDLIKQQQRERMKNATALARDQKEHDRAVQKFADSVADLLTGDVISPESLRALQALRLGFAEVRQVRELAVKVASVYDDRPSLRRSMLAAMLVAVAEQMV